MKFRSPVADEVLIQQKWFEGERWWREYERFVNGRRDLHARRVETPTQAQQDHRAGSPAQRAVDAYYLRKDVRLQAQLALVSKNPKVEELLDRLRQATRLNFSVDKTLEKHQPAYGDLQLRRARAFTIMEIMEKKDLEHGHWEPVGDGYQLVGRSTIRRNPLPAAAEKHRPLWALGAGALALLLMGVAGCLLVRQRCTASRRAVAPGARR